MPSSALHRDLPSFPTRRSSDLQRERAAGLDASLGEHVPHGFHLGADGRERALVDQIAVVVDQACAMRGRQLAPGARHRLEAARGRSEEHTSELQSRVDLVCRLLLSTEIYPLSLHDALPICSASGLPGSMPRSASMCRTASTSVPMAASARSSTRLPLSSTRRAPCAAASWRPARAIAWKLRAGDRKSVV